MKIKTSELTDAALDWVVGKCEGIALNAAVIAEEHKHRLTGWYFYSTDWSQGGPIIERKKIHMEHDDVQWIARHYPRQGVQFYEEGPTPLIAAMRCYVASKLGDEVDVPEELVA